MSLTRLSFLFILSLWNATEIFCQRNKDPLEDSISFYQARKEYAKLIPFAEARRITIRKKKGITSAEYASILNVLGDALRRNGQTNEAAPILQECLEIRTKLFGENHPDVASIFYSLGGLYARSGNLEKAEAYYKEALRIREKTLGENHQELSRSIYTLGYLYSKMGNYSDAETFYLRSLEMDRKLVGETDVSLGYSYNALGSLYNDWGNYQKAETSFLKAIEIWKKALGEDHIDLANTYNNLGNLYEHLGNYKEAERYFLKSLGIWKRAYGEHHPDVADGYNNLGVMYLEMKNFPMAEFFLLKSLAIKRQILGDLDQEIGAIYLNLGTLYYVIGDYLKASNMYLASLEVYGKILDENHVEMADLYNNLGGVFMRMGNGVKGEQYFQKALTIFQRTVGELHSHVAISYNRLGQVNHEMGDFKKAEHNYLLFQRSESELFQRYFPFLSDGEKEKYVEKGRPYLEAFKSFCVDRYRTNPSITGDFYNQQLATKAMLLNSSAKWRHRIKSSGDAETNHLYDAWNESQSRLNNLFQSFDSTERKGIDPVQRNTEKLEKQLSIRSENFTKLTDRKLVTWQDVQRGLKKNEAAVEIIRTWKFGARNTFTDTTDPKKPTYNVYGLTDTVFYVALIVKPESKYPEMAVLENGNELENTILKQYRKCIRRQIEDVNSYQNFWQKIQKRLGSTRTIYLSADGVYHKINLNTLQNPKTKKYLLDELDIRMVTVTKDILSNAGHNGNSKTADLVGFPKFYQSGSDSIGKPDGPKLNGIWFENMKLEELPSTKLEVDRINTLLSSFGWAVKTYMGETATEENIRKIAQPKLLHIATHGFFHPDSSTDFNPLLRSGLMLAGAASSLKGHVDVNRENGILTSAEAMNLNLDNTDLVVLSACETGLGDVKNGEGVYGLQRAFKVAGAKSIIMSLWKVSDQVTQELMVNFYKNWLDIDRPDRFQKHVRSENSKRSSFLQAQRQLKLKYPDPFYWGAFVMLGE